MIFDVKMYVFSKMAIHNFEYFYYSFDTFTVVSVVNYFFRFVSNPRFENMISINWINDGTAYGYYDTLIPKYKYNDIINDLK